MSKFLQPTQDVVLGALPSGMTHLIFLFLQASQVLVIVAAVAVVAALKFQ